MQSIFSVLSAIKRKFFKIDQISIQLEELKICNGTALAELHRSKSSKRLKDYEFKVFSQWGEDGIIQHLIEVLELHDSTFIEFGVEDFSESNCRFLLMKDNWRGFVIDGSPDNIRRLKESRYYWKYDLAAIDSFITKENINEVLAKSGFGEQLGILSIDVDGNDYHLLEAIHFFKPRILICEYNAVFGPIRKISIPYNSGFVRSKMHYSNLYYGASLAAIAHVAGNKGYSLVGTNSSGTNAFFVLDQLVNDRLEVLNPIAAYTASKCRESRDQSGSLSYLSGEDRLNLIRGLPVVNVETDAMESL
jgi:hypothetical protein